MTNHTIYITNTAFSPSTDTVARGDTISFALGGGRTAQAAVTWTTGLFHPSTANPLIVTSTGATTKDVYSVAEYGEYPISADSVNAQGENDPMNGTITVSTKNFPTERR